MKKEIAAEFTRPVPGKHAAWIALGLLTTLNLFNYIDRYILPGVQPLVQREFHASDERMGALTFAFFVTYMIAAPLTGWLGDRFPRKPLIIAGAVLWRAATLLKATFHSYGMLYLRHAVVGIGEASFSIFAPAVLADFWPEEQRNRILTFFYLSLPIGAALGYILGGTLGNAYGWRFPFYICALPGMLLAAAIFFWMEEPHRGATESLTPTADRATYAGLMHNRGYWTATLGMAMMVFSLGGISVWMPTFLYRNGHYSLPVANQLLGAITVGTGIAGTWLGGWLAQRWLRRNHAALYLLSAWSVLLAIPAAVLTFFGPRSEMVAWLAVAEFFLFLNTGPLNAAIVKYVAAPVRSTAIALELFLIHSLGDAPSPRLIGWVSDHSSLPEGLGLTLITMVLSAGLLFLGARYAPPLETFAEEN